jgi:hypothetical protein
MLQYGSAGHPTPAMALFVPAAILTDMERLFDLRRMIARLGESDWMRWWNSNALTDAGRYAMPRLFSRTAELSAAHVAIATARVRHDAAVPREPLVHLFNLSEAFEGAFERWLIGRKAEGLAIEPLPRPTADQKQSSASALSALGIQTAPHPPVGGNTVALGRVAADSLQNARERVQLAERLAAAYAASEPGRLVVPYFRLER